MIGVDTTVIDPFLRYLWDRKGTDLHLTAGAPALVRVDGALEPIAGAPVLSPEESAGVVYSLLDAERRVTLERNGQIDFSFDWRGVARLRANAFSQRGTMALAVRLIPFEIPSFEQLGVPMAVARIVDFSQGLVLVTGPTGSGKSTTLAAIIDAINKRHRKHIITIEEPLEYVHHHQRCAVNQREVGIDCENFEDALRAALREDPDVILLGEMRDLETIQTALTFAETGHLVFATLHTNDAAMTIDRVVDVFPTDRQTQIRVQLAGALSMVVAQRLVPRIGGGRVAAFEILTATPAVRNLVREGKSMQLRNVISTGGEQGMQTLEAHLAALVRSGIVTHEDAVRVSLHPNELPPA
ncbi:MAG: type IV pilus twitching motility protein PilT [Actinomycetota bacterium]